MRSNTTPTIGRHAALFLATILPASAFGQTFVIMPVPDTFQTTGNTAAEVFEVDSAGVLVGNRGTPFNTVATRWTNLVPSNAPVPAGFTGVGTANAINDQGSIAGTQNWPGVQVPHVTTWIGGVPYWYGPFTALGTNLVTAINENDWSVGAYLPLFSYTPWYTDGTIHDDLPTPGILGGVAEDINNAGLIVGSVGAYFPSLVTDAVVWEQVGGAYPNQPVTLSSLSTSTPSGDQALSVNDLGQIVGVSRNATGTLRAVRWQNTTAPAVPLGLCPAGAAGRANAVNDNGLVVGDCDFGGSTTAAIGGIAPTGPLLNRATDGHGWAALNTAVHVSESNLIVGQGERLSGSTVSYVAIPINKPLMLSDPSPGVAGQANTLTVTDATPGANITFRYGSLGGTTGGGGCPNLYDLTSTSVAGVVQADANGVAQWVGTPPAGFSGNIVNFQAADESACEPSNLMIAVWE